MRARCASERDSDHGLFESDSGGNSDILNGLLFRNGDFNDF